MSMSITKPLKYSKDEKEHHYSFCILHGGGCNAQVWQIERTDGQIIEINVEDIQEMRFKEEVAFEGTTPENLEIVDLGHSVDWVSLNVGANSPEETGCYVSWGGTEQKNYYSWSYYEHGTSQSSMDKYKQDGRA